MPDTDGHIDFRPDQIPGDVWIPWSIQWMRPRMVGRVVLYGADGNTVSSETRLIHSARGKDYEIWNGLEWKSVGEANITYDGDFHVVAWGVWRDDRREIDMNEVNALREQINAENEGE